MDKSQEKKHFLTEEIHNILDNILLDIIPDNNHNFDLISEHFSYILQILELMGFRIQLGIPLFYHIRVKEQYTESLCGFHALFYAKTFLKSIYKAKNPLDSQKYIQKLKSNACFWKFYQKTLKKVLSNPLLDPLDVEDLNKMGPLDSSHLDFLIEKQSFFKKYPVAVASLFYGYGYFQCGVERVRHFDQQSQRIMGLNSKLDKENNEFLISFLGITSHWLCFIKHKSGVSLLFDSRNDEFFLDEQKNLDFLLEREEKERKFIGKKPFSLQERKLFLHNMRDGRFMLKILMDKGVISLLEIYINRLIYDLIRSYQSKVVGQELEEYYFEEFSLKKTEFTYDILIESENISQSEIQKKFKLWVRQEKGPRAIREDILDILKDIGKKYLNEKTKFFLLSWLEEALQMNQQVMACESDNVFIEFDKILKEIQIFLN